MGSELVISGQVRSSNWNSTKDVAVSIQIDVLLLTKACPATALGCGVGIAQSTEMFQFGGLTRSHQYFELSTYFILNLNISKV